MLSLPRAEKKKKQTLNGRKIFASPRHGMKLRILPRVCALDFGSGGREAERAGNNGRQRMQGQLKHCLMVSPDSKAASLASRTPV